MTNRLGFLCNPPPAAELLLLTLIFLLRDDFRGRGVEVEEVLVVLEWLALLERADESGWEEVMMLLVQEFVAFE